MKSWKELSGFRPGLQPRGHEMELYDSVAAYTATLGQAEAERLLRERLEDGDE